MHDVMVTAGGLQLAAAVVGPKNYHPDYSNREKDSKSTNAAFYFVLRHITARTIAFGKFFEFVTQNEIVNGMANLAIHPAPVSHFHIKYGLSSMSPPNGNLLVKLRFKNIVTSCYSVNWPGLLKLICLYWYNDLDKLQDQRQQDNRELTLSNNCLTGFAKAVLCAEYLEQYRKAFQFLLTQNQRIDSADDLVNQVKKKLPKRLKPLADDRLSGCNKPSRLRQEWRESIETGEPFRGFEVDDSD